MPPTEEPKIRRGRNREIAELNFDPNDPVVEIDPRYRRAMRHTVQEKREKLKSDGRNLEARDAFIKELAKTRMYGLGAPGGDMIGGPYEYIVNNTYRTDFEMFGPYSVTTDDGKLALAVGNVLATKDLLNMSLEEAANTMMYAYFDCVWREQDVNGGWGPAFQNLANSEAAVKHELKVPTLASIGNGGPMRVGSVISAAKNPVEAMLLAEKTALGSHGAPLGVESTMADAVTGWMLMHDYDPVYIRAFCRTTFRGMHWKYTVENARERYKHSRDMSDKGFDTVTTAIDAALSGRGGKTYAGITKYAISAGGDSDTIGAMAGGIAEAAYGMTEYEKENVMNGLDDIELQRAITFNAFAVRRQMEIAWDKKYAKSIVCGEKPRLVYENILKESFQKDALKEMFGDELPGELSDIFDALNDPSGEAYRNLTALSGKAAADLQALYERLNDRMFKNYDAAAVQKVAALNELVAVVEGLSKAPVAPVRDVRSDAYDTLGKRADQLSLDLLWMRQEARTPPADWDTDRKKAFVVIEPDTKEYQLGRLAETALRNMQTAVKDSCFKNQNLGDLALSEKDLAALFLYEHVKLQKSIQALDARTVLKDETMQGIRKGKLDKAIKAADDYLKALNDGDLDQLIEAVQNDAKFKAFAATLDAGKVNEVLQKPDGLRQAYRDFKAPENAVGPAAGDDLLKGIGLKDNTAQPREIEDQVGYEQYFETVSIAAEEKAAIEQMELEAREQKLEPELAFGEETRRYHKAALLNMMGEEMDKGLAEIFPQKSDKELAFDQEGRDYQRHLNILLKRLPGELKALHGAETENKVDLSAMEVTETLDEISKLLNDKLDALLPDADEQAAEKTYMERMNTKEAQNLMKQISFITRLQTAVDNISAAAIDPPANEKTPGRERLYNDLNDRLRAADNMEKELANRRDYKVSLELTKRAKEGMEKIQEALKKDAYSSGGTEDKALDAVKSGDTLAALFMYQQLEANYRVTKLADPDYSADQGYKNDFQKNKSAAKKIVNGINKAKNVDAVIKSVKKDPAFAALVKDVDAAKLITYMNKPGAMLQAYRAEKLRLEPPQNEGPANEATNAKAKDTAPAVLQNGQPGFGNNK